MTEEGNSNSNTNIKNRRPPKTFYLALDECIGHQVKSRKAFDRAIDIAKSNGFSDFEIVLFTKDYLKDKIPHSSLYRYINELSPKPVFPLGQIDSKNVLDHGVKIDEIKIGKRLRDAEPDYNLIESIRHDGLIVPITINKDKLLICGKRRLDACKILKWDRIPAMTIDVTDEVKILLCQFHENEFRRIPSISEVREYEKACLESYRKEGHGFIPHIDYNHLKNQLLDEFYKYSFEDPDYDRKSKEYEKELDSEIEVIKEEKIKGWNYFV